ncbi:type VI secretion system tip protein VgrG [Pseudomonas sp. NFXW11]|uniref:contractile injection system protein, VgrG/Pvc8 family n=1 Tax=Pseudomonas sp. NFXW11 TaxID=2819531 RepID=UPI003CF6B768
MFSPANQVHFALTIDGLEQDFQVLAFTGEEGINRPYLFNIELLSQRSDLDLQSFFDRQAFLAFDNQGNGVHGRIYHLAQSANGRYHLALVPHLSYLRHRINQRIYQGFSVPKIIALILEEHGILGEAYRFDLAASYPERDCCTQYEETDLHFIQRLCEEEGIHFHFRHSAQGHVLVFADRQAAFPRIEQPGRCAMQRSHGAYHQAEGQSQQTGLASGHVLDIGEHQDRQWNDLWLLTQVSHEGRQPQVPGESLGAGNSGAEDDGYQGYRNRFQVRPWSQLYRPPLTHRKPQVPGSQSAIVIALEDRERQAGRVKVRFPWDREGRFDDKSSCWLQMASDCPGEPLSMGMEVLVTFVENDPDRPLLGGCLLGR